MSKQGVIIAGIATGVALELGIHALSGRREAWDSQQFWAIGIPAALLVSAVIGYVSRTNDWLWTVVIVPAQVLTMLLRSGEIGGLWPLAVGFSAILSAPFIVAAFVGSRFRGPR